MRGGDYLEIQEQELPGIGSRYDFKTKKDRRVGVVHHKDGHRELLVYKDRDPDAVSESIHFTNAEADAMAEFLGTRRIIEKLAEVTDQVEELDSREIEIKPGTPAANEEKGNLDVKKKTGASIVAVRRGTDVTISPLPDFKFQVGDKMIVVGDEESLDTAQKLIDG